MRVRTVLVVGLLTAILAGVVPAATAGAPVAASTVPRAAGKTVLTGARSAHQRIRLTRAAVVDLTPTAGKDGALRPAALHTAGGRGYVGFLLTAPDMADGFYVAGARLPRRLVDGDSKIAAVGHGRTIAGGKTVACVRCEIPAGVYDLHLVTGRKTAAVTITFGGLSGRRRLRPATPTTTYAFASSLHSDDYDSGEFLPGTEYSGWGLGMEWYERSTGVMLSTYEMTLLPDAGPAAAASVEVCRTVRRSSECDDHRTVAGSAPIAGSGVFPGRATKTMETMLWWDLYGFTEHRSRLSVLWIGVPAAPARRASAPAPASGALAPVREWVKTPG